MNTSNYNIPFVIEQTGKGERTYDIFTRLLVDRIIFITGEVNDEMANAICAQLLFLKSQDKEKPISCYINSPGGSVTAGFAIIDTMKHIGCQINTYCMGQAASMGALILSCGTKGHRYALPNARIMIHQPSGGARGMASDVEISYNELQRLKVVINELLATNTGKSVDEILKDTDRDNYMSSEEAKAYGIIDEIVG